jgi:hypothetical protein
VAKALGATVDQISPDWKNNSGNIQLAIQETDISPPN